jgi:hypothetical protein
MGKQKERNGKDSGDDESRKGRHLRCRERLILVEQVMKALLSMFFLPVYFLDDCG